MSDEMYPYSLKGYLFKKLPFYKNISTIHEPSILPHLSNHSIKSYPEGVIETTFLMRLSTEQAAYIVMNGNNLTENDSYQIQIRIGQPQESVESTDYFPYGLCIHVNEQLCYSYDFCNPESNDRPTASRPIDCTKLVKTNGITTIKVNWIDDIKTYFIGVYLVKVLTLEMLIQKLNDRGTRNSEKTKNDIIEMFLGFDTDVTATHYDISLLCPFTKNKMKIPARSNKCHHFQCFDLKQFLLMNQKNLTWKCPLCNNAIFYNDIQIDDYFLEIVSSPNLPDSCDRVQLLNDGTWRAYEVPVADAYTNKISIDCNVDEIEYFKEATKNTISENSEESENLTIAVQVSEVTANLLNSIDLTLSDDDESQATNAVQGVNTQNPQTLNIVQPQQDVEIITVWNCDSLLSPASPSTYLQ